MNKRQRDGLIIVIVVVVAIFVGGTLLSTSPHQVVQQPTHALPPLSQLQQCGSATLHFGGENVTSEVVPALTGC